MIKTKCWSGILLIQFGVNNESIKFNQNQKNKSLFNGRKQKNFH